MRSRGSLLSGILLVAITAFITTLARDKRSTRRSQFHFIGAVAGEACRFGSSRDSSGGRAIWRAAGCWCRSPSGDSTAISGRRASSHPQKCETRRNQRCTLLYSSFGRISSGRVVLLEVLDIAGTVHGCHLRTRHLGTRLSNAPSAQSRRG